MKFYQDSIQTIMNKIIESELPYEHTVIIGDNSSGKSLLLNLLVKSQKDSQNIY